VSDLASLLIVVAVVACVAILALYTVARQEREIERLKEGLKKKKGDR